MIKWIKKQKYKIAIALCSILSIFTIFLGINKTYAYETDTFSYTTTLYTDNTYQTEVTLSTYNNIDNLYYLSNRRIYFNINNMYNNTYLSNYYFMINFYLWNDNYQLIYSGNNITFTIFPNGYNTTYMPNERASNNGFYTAIFKYNSDNLVYSNNSLSLNIGFNFSADLYIKNIDIVTSSDIGLSQYYETYYGQIEDNYNILLDNYNDLQEDYSTLETNYNDLNTNYENYYNSMYMGNFANLNNINWYNNNYDITITQDELLNNEYYSFDFAQWDIYNYFMNYNWDENNLPTGTLEIDFNFNNTNLNLLSLELGNTNQYLTTYQVFLKDSTNTIKIINLPLASDYTINLEYLQSLVNYTLDNHYFYMLKIYNYLYGEDIPNDQKTDIKATITYDSYYYQYGYNNGVNSQQGIIQNKDAEINEKNTTIDLLQQSIRGEYQRGYRDGYEVGSNEDISQSGFTTLLNSIMSYPVNFLRSLFNFEFMGINLFGVLTFFVSLGIVMFVIHRFKK